MPKRRALWKEPPRDSHWRPILAIHRAKLSFEPGSIDAKPRLLSRLDPSPSVSLGQKTLHRSKQSRFVELLNAKGQLLRDNDAISQRVSFLHTQTIPRRAIRNHCDHALLPSGLALLREGAAPLGSSFMDWAATAAPFPTGLEFTSYIGGQLRHGHFDACRHRCCRARIRNRHWHRARDWR